MPSSMTSTRSSTTKRMASVRVTCMFQSLEIQEIGRKGRKKVTQLSVFWEPDADQGWCSLMHMTQKMPIQGVSRVSSVHATINRGAEPGRECQRGTKCGHNKRSIRQSESMNGLQGIDGGSQDRTTPKEDGGAKNRRPSPVLVGVGPGGKHSW